MVDGTAAIVAHKLSKRYPGAERFALKDLSIKVMPGEVYGFLGPNGAGKSTTIRLLMNFIQPTSGSAQIRGLDVVRDSVAIKVTVGYLSGEVALYPKMTGHQFFCYMGELAQNKQPAYLRELIKLFQSDVKPRIGQLSKGNRQKVGVIQAFMNQPEILILDEPTVGLDPLMQEAFFELVRQTKARGASLFISSHNLSEVQKMCDRVGFIREGRLIAEQPITDLSNSAVQIYNIAFALSVPIAELKRIKGAKVKINSSKHATVQIRGDLKPLFALLVRHKVTSLDRQETNLEEEFLRYYSAENEQ